MNKKQTSTQQDMLTVAHVDYSKNLNSHAFFRLNNRSLSEDLVQETFMKTWRYLIRGGKIEVIKSFLYHVLNKLIIDEYRKRKTVSLDTLTDNGFEPGVDYSESTRIFNVIDGRAASQLIDRLPEAYRKIMKMRFIQDLTLKEISSLTNQTRNALAVRVHRGMVKLRALYSYRSQPKIPPKDL